MSLHRQRRDRTAAFALLGAACAGIYRKQANWVKASGEIIRYAIARSIISARC